MVSVPSTSPCIFSALKECAERGRKYEVPVWYLQLHIDAPGPHKSAKQAHTFSGSVKRSYYNQTNTKIFSDNTVQPGTYVIWIWAEIKWRSTAWRSSCAETTNISGWHLMKHFLPRHGVIAETTFYVLLLKTWGFFRASLISVIIRGIQIFLNFTWWIKSIWTAATRMLFGRFSPRPRDKSALCFWAE